MSHSCEPHPIEIDDSHYSRNVYNAEERQELLDAIEAFLGDTFYMRGLVLDEGERGTAINVIRQDIFDTVDTEKNPHFFTREKSYQITLFDRAYSNSINVSKDGVVTCALLADRDNPSEKHFEIPFVKGYRQYILKVLKDNTNKGRL